MIAREKIVNNYIDAYSNFDIERMCANLDENIKFENISNGVSNMALQGLTSFKKQAEQAKIYLLQELKLSYRGHTRRT